MAKQIFTQFPDELAEGPSKAALKKLAKIQAAKDAKEAKKTGGDKPAGAEKQGKPAEAGAAGLEESKEAAQPSQAPEKKPK